MESPPPSPRLTGAVTPPGSDPFTHTNTPVKPSHETAAQDLLCNNNRYGVSLVLLDKPNLTVEEFFGPSIASPVRDLADALKKAESGLQSAKGENAMYQPICYLLNQISKSVLRDLEPGTAPLIFRPFPRTPPKSWGSSEYITKPDFGCYQGTVGDFDKPVVELRDPPAWPALDGTGEGKISWAEGDIPQIVDYVKSNLEQRPDKGSALGIHATKTGYVLVRVDSVRICRTEPLEWKNFSPLVSYVRELYLAPRDTSMTRKSNYWQVDFRGAQYKAFPIYGATPPGRRSWVAIAEDPNDPTRLVIVKDIWWDTGRNHLEGELLQKIHTPKVVPGVVECLASGHVDSPPTQSFTSSGGTVERRKYRVILGQVGFPLSSCRSTLDFLKLCLDAVQVHRKCIRRGVLHRDLAWNNLLVCPKRGLHGVKRDMSDEVCFVDTVIGGGEDNQLGPRCLIADFDNASLWGPSETTKGPTLGQQDRQPQRTGTPMFVAVDFAVNGMTPDTYEKHTSTQFGAGLYVVHPPARTYAEKYKLVENSKFQHHLKAVAEWTTKLKTNEDQRGDFPNPILHAPYHDMESLFWCIAWHCARSQPLLQDKTGSGTTDLAIKDDSSLYALFCEVMLNNKISLGRDFREDFRKDKASEWEKILHPSLGNKGLGDMLSAMGKYLSLPWQLFPGGAYPERGHDMMTLVLLNTISLLDDPIELHKLPRQLPLGTKKKVGVRTSTVGETSLKKLSESMDRLTLAPHNEDEVMPVVGPAVGHRRSERNRARNVTRTMAGVVEAWYHLLVTNKFWFK